MKDVEALINSLFIKHTDGDVPENIEEFLEKDLYSEAALSILKEILVATGYFKE